MKYLIVGAAGFIGTNLTLYLSKNKEETTLIDRDISFFNDIVKDKADIIIDNLDLDTDFEKLTRGYDIVFHLVSFSHSVSESIDSEKEISTSISFTNKLLNACNKNNIKKVIFISSGGTVYGKNENCPIKEECPLEPISAYGLEKTKDEECFKDYNRDHHIFRLANPYGPYQRLSGAVGAVTKFLHKALNDEMITIVGDGSVTRDYINIDDALEAMFKVINSSSKERIYNIGSGIGTSVNELLEIVARVSEHQLNVEYKEGRKADVPINYLDISKYEKAFGKLAKTSLHEGIKSIIEYYK